MHKTMAKIRNVVLASVICTVPAQAATPGFSDQTTAAGLTFSHTMLPDTPGLPMHAGGAAGDFNNDGWPDLFILGSGAAPDKLFINDQLGGFTDEWYSWFNKSENMPLLYRGVGANTGDFNNDGWLDIFVTSMGDLPGAPEAGKHRLYRNNGDGTFSNIATAAGVNQTSPYPDGYGSTFGDIDLDGDLDLWVGGWHLDNGQIFGGNALGTRLFRNNGNETFTDISISAGIADPKVRGFGAIFADTNGDRYPELLVAGDFGTSRYFVNNRNGYTATYPLLPGSTEAHNGMGTTLADINRDGLMDWFVTAIYPAYNDQGPPGNRLYINQGNDQFLSAPESSGVNDGGWGWGAIAIDFNHDGWVDLAHTNGWRNCDTVTGECFDNEQSYLFESDKDGTFTEVGVTYGMNNIGQGRCMMDLDYDRDGDRDIVILSNQGELYLARNDLFGDDANWLQIELDSSANPALSPDGWGANVSVSELSGTQTVRMNGGSNYLCGSEQIAHFGTSAADTVDVKVTWTDGFETMMQNVAVNQRITVAAELPYSNSTPIAGQVLTLEVKGLRPGEVATFGRSDVGTGSGPCLASHGGLCTNILQPTELGTAVADASGTASLGGVVSAGTNFATQAIIRRGDNGRNSLKTNVLEISVP